MVSSPIAFLVGWCLIICSIKPRVVKKDFEMLVFSTVFTLALTSGRMF